MVGAYSIGLDLRLDFTVLALTTGLMFVAVVATGMAPALYASSPNLAHMLSGEIMSGMRKSRRRNILVIAQVAVCTLVLVGMGLCERSLYNLKRVDPGFAQNLVAMLIFPQGNASGAQREQLNERLRSAVAAIAGVESVAFAKRICHCRLAILQMRLSQRHGKEDRRRTNGGRFGILRNLTHPCHGRTHFQRGRHGDQPRSRIDQSNNGADVLAGSGSGRQVPACGYAGSHNNGGRSGGRRQI